MGPQGALGPGPGARAWGPKICLGFGTQIWLGPWGPIFGPQGAQIWDPWAPGARFLGPKGPKLKFGDLKVGT